MPDILEFLPMGDDEDNEYLIIIPSPFEQTDVEIEGDRHTAHVYEDMQTVLWTKVWLWNLFETWNENVQLFDNLAAAPTREGAIFCARVSITLLEAPLYPHQLQARLNDRRQ